jgi:excisionase family DNA binding protein
MTMSQVAHSHDVLTLDEAASFLRISVQAAEELATRGTIPGRRIQNEWRFLRSAIEDWLRRPDYRRALFSQAGSLRDDESLTDMRNAIFAARGRPEVDNSGER